ncbi:hypothetical protein [Kaistia terrae]|uniref:Secreted protein n=1 Tax=Kaistia terrae TaxID=537017 RepID=A0ABW0Q4Z5_9HYPH|nr:hypothetical protein [Kaistia terrae]MCX5580310.1 hypothetical protein [Kaistia terrae]
MRVPDTLRRAGLILCWLALLPVSGAALAETANQAPATTPSAPGPSDSARTGRYTMVPAEGGFVRLDTETGTVSHCRRGDATTGSVWTCAAIPENVLSRPDPAVALSDKVDALSREVAALRSRLDDVDGRMKTRAVAPPTGDPELDRALNFSEELMSRFFGMVREMKREADDNKT